MATIYIDPTRGTNGTGTFADPRNTWTSLTFVAGNTYLQKAGTTFTSSATQAIFVGVTGTSGNRITIGSYDPVTGAPTTEKAKIVGGTRYGVQCGSGVGYVTIQDLDISGVGIASNTNFGITWVAASDSTDVSNYALRCDIHDLIAGSPNDTNGISTRGANNIVADCNFWNIPNDAIYGRGQNWIVERNRVWNINTDGLNQADAFQCLGDCTGLIIRDNYFDASNGEGKQVVLLGQTTGTSHTIENNILIGPPNAQQGIFSDSPVTISRNIIYDCIHGIRLNGGASTVRANVILNNRSDDASYKAIWLDSDGHTVVNNTMINIRNNIADQTGIFLDADFTGNTIRNNLIVNFNRGIRLSGTSLQVETNNCFDNCVSPILDDGVPVALNATSFQANAGIDPRYKPTNLLLAASGSSVTGTDFYGNSFRGQTIGAVDMGPNGLPSIFKSTEAKGNSEDFHGKKRKDR